MTVIQDSIKEIVQWNFSLMCSLTGLWLCGLDDGGKLKHWSHDGFEHVLSPPAVNLETMCADDLLSVLLYLLVKTEIPNW